MQDHSSELLAAQVILYTHINYINYSTHFLFLGNNRVHVIHTLYIVSGV